MLWNPEVSKTDNKKFTEKELLEYKKTFEENMKEFLEILQKNKNDQYKQIETYLDYKDKKEKEIEELLNVKSTHIEEIKIHIGFLIDIISLIGYFRLMKADKIDEAKQYFYNDYINLKKELYKKYKINESSEVRK